MKGVKFWTNWRKKAQTTGKPKRSATGSPEAGYLRNSTFYEQAFGRQTQGFFVSLHVLKGK